MSDVNMSQLKKVLKASKYISLHSADGLNLVSNSYIMVSLSDDDFWEVRAALLLRDENARYEKNGRNFVKFGGPYQMLKLLEDCKASQLQELVDTELRSDLGDDDVRIFARSDGRLTLVRTNYCGLFDDEANFQQASELTPILVNKKHLITPVRYDEFSPLKWVVNPVAKQEAVS